jgi:beta-lactam-binding protein with PASTA domain/tRNA A-37 threonylcarbamoyl transferase component Bud32
MAEHLGRVLGGRYRIVAPIGVGASAQVFLADDVTLRRRVAVKLLHPALADDEGFLRRFRAEAQAAAALSHPNVMAVFDSGQADDGPFLVLEYLGGGSLRGILDRGFLLTPAQALLVGLEAARGLDYAHRRGFVHRDIKPANLLFDDDARLRIADFGLARALAEAAWTEPQGAVVGTARYASPEQARGEAVDGRADVYALGLVLIEAVTGRVPFAADTTIGTLMARIDTPVPVPGELAALVPALEWAGLPHPADRPDAAQLVDAFMRAAPELDRPGPLPLVGALSDNTTVVVADPDPTLLPGRGANGETGDEPTVVTTVPRRIDRDEIAVVDDEPPRRRRRLVPRSRAGRWGLIALLLLIAGAAGVGAWFGWQEVMVETAPVPSIDGLTAAEARDAIAAAQREHEVRWDVLPEQDYVDGVEAGRVVGQDPNPAEELRDGGTLRYTISRGPPPVPVPAIQGLPEAEAVAALERAGLEVASSNADHHEEIEAGRVIAWWFEGAEMPAEIPKGSGVDLVVSEGPAPRPIPDLTGAKREDAEKQLQELGLKPQVVEEFSRTVEKGLVIRTEPRAGQTAPRDAAVSVVVSKGRDLVKVPNMSGMTIAQATQALAKAGLERGDIFGRGETVFQSDPEFGSEIDRGSVVNLYVRP